MIRRLRRAWRRVDFVGDRPGFRCYRSRPSPTDRTDDADFLFVGIVNSNGEAILAVEIDLHEVHPDDLPER